MICSKKQGLYDPANEHDACGVGFIAHIKGENVMTSFCASEILKNLDHRGAWGPTRCRATARGILIQIPTSSTARRWRRRA